MGVQVAAVTWWWLRNVAEDKDHPVLAIVVNEAGDTASVVIERDAALMVVNPDGDTWEMLREESADAR